MDLVHLGHITENVTKKEMYIMRDKYGKPIKYERFYVYGIGTVSFKAVVEARNKAEAKKLAMERDYYDIDTEDFRPTKILEVE
jgi:uncharacterized protein (DUF2235 family)